MATVESLGRKLRVGEELHSVVGTMKGLAAVAIHEYERAVRALREYTATIELGLQALFMAAPALIPDASETPGVSAGVVIGTDQGLCGPINREIALHARDFFDDGGVGAQRRHIAALGVRTARELALAGIPPDEQLALPGSVETIGPIVEDLIVRIDRWREADDVGRVLLFFQHPIRRTSRTPRVFQVVPPDAVRLRGIAQRPWPTRMLPAFPRRPAEMLAGLLRQDLFIALYRAVAEAKAAEHGARLSAMQAAEQNIEERLEALQTEYHQLRQAEITAGLLDVVSGYEALQPSDRS